MQIQELSKDETLEVSGGEVQTVTVTGTKMTWWEKLMYDACVAFGGSDC